MNCLLSVENNNNNVLLFFSVTILSTTFGLDYYYHHKICNYNMNWARLLLSCNSFLVLFHTKNDDNVLVGDGVEKNAFFTQLNCSTNIASFIFSFAIYIFVISLLWTLPAFRRCDG